MRVMIRGWGKGNLRGTLPPVAVRVEFNRRDYLNGLVAMSILTRDDQLSNVALMRTHKTGSTTLATLFYRYGRRHGLEVAQFVGSHSTIPIAQAAQKTQQSQRYVDIMHYHIGEDGPLVGTWDEAKDLYKQILRDPDNINFITIFREPREHLLSYYTFFIEPITRLPISIFLGLENPDPELLKRLENSLCQEFGLQTPEDLEHFITSSLPEFQLVMITERFDESLMVLRHILRWHMIDMTYVYLNQTAGLKKGGEVLPERSPFDELPRNVRDKIDELTRMDKRLYEAGVAEFEKSKAPIATEVDADMVVFEQLQTVVNEYLNNNRRSPVNPMYRVRAFYESPPPMHDF
eukprot:jgi/Undpi1/13020/HiC_scaffold_8.g02683.m1